jgi:hypothetical protein
MVETNRLLACMADAYDVAPPRAIWLGIVVLLAFAAPLAAQRPDSTRRDTTRRAMPDSAAIADSLRIIRELERIRGEPRARPESPPAQGPSNPRLLPDISAVGDLIGDLSPKRTTQEDGSRFGVREVEVALQAAVDPFFRGDVFLGVSDGEGVSIEQAFLTATALPWGLEARLGRFLMPIAKQATTHRHDLHTFEYPWAIQRFLGEEGLKGTGIWLSRVFAPFGYYQEVQLTAVDRFGEKPEDLSTLDPVNKKLDGLGYSARLRNYWDLSEASNLELSGSAVTGKVEQPVSGGPLDLATPARQTVVGVDFTYRWRPLQRGLYKSFMLQAEVLRQINQRDPSLPSSAEIDPATLAYAGPDRDFSGAYVFTRYQVTRRSFIAARFDALQDPTQPGVTVHAASGYLEFFPSEFSKLLAGFEHLDRPGDGLAKNRLILQATFALGPHKPHPF